MIFEAWAGNEYAIDEVRYTVIEPPPPPPPPPTTYSYTVSVSGLRDLSTSIYLNGEKKVDLRDGESYMFTGLTGSNNISTNQLIMLKNNGSRLYCSQFSIIVSSEGSYTFQYKMQHFLQINIKPEGAGSTSIASGWYDEGKEFSITAFPTSGYLFRGWQGDYTSSKNIVTFTLTKPISITAWFGRLNNISCKVSSHLITRLNAIGISGKITPSPGYSVKLKISFTTPNGNLMSRDVITNAEGYYELLFTPDIAGDWMVKASWEGDEAFCPSESAAVRFTVQPIKYSFTLNTNLRWPEIVCETFT